VRVAVASAARVAEGGSSEAAGMVVTAGARAGAGVEGAEARGATRGATAAAAAAAAAEPEAEMEEGEKVEVARAAKSENKPQSPNKSVVVVSPQRCTCSNCIAKLIPTIQSLCSRLLSV